MLNITIEKFTKNDLPELAFVMREAFNSVDQGWSIEDSEGYIQDYFDCAFNICAKDEGRIVGILISDSKENKLFIDAIAVLPSEMGKGIANKLFEEAKKYSKDKKLESIKMITDPKSKAYQWYKRLGFEDTGWVEMELNI